MDNQEEQKSSIFVKPASSHGNLNPSCCIYNPHPPIITSGKVTPPALKTPEYHFKSLFYILTFFSRENDQFLYVRKLDMQDILWRPKANLL